MKQHINNETSTIFDQKHYIGTIIITPGTKNKFLLEFYIFFNMLHYSFNGLIILPSISCNKSKRLTQ